MRLSTKIVGTLLAALAVSASLSLAAPASAQVEDPVSRAIAGMTVMSGNTPHNVGEELPKLDALRTKILAAIAAKTEAKDYNLAEELKTLDRLDSYSSKLADLVTAHKPDAKDVIAWLQANAAVAGAWREAYTSTAKFADNSRMAELKAIETRIGRKFTGGMGGDIKGLKAVDDSATSRAALEELGRRVRLASGLVEKDAGLTKLTLKVQPTVVEPGKALITVVGVALGGGGADGTTGDSPTESIRYEMWVTGPQNFAVGNLTKTYAPGAAVGTTGYFTIPTRDLPDGYYTAHLHATDTHNHTKTAVDIFEVKRRPLDDGAIARGARRIGAGLVLAFNQFSTGSGFEHAEIYGPDKTFVRFGRETGDNQSGYAQIYLLTGFEKSWENLKTSKVYRKTSVNGKEAYVYTGNKSGSPEAILDWVNDGLYCTVSVCLINEKFGDDTVKKVETRALEIANKLDPIVDKNKDK